MGCASSKKQTRSVEDIPGAVNKESAKPTQASAPLNKSTNGQVANDTKSATPPLIMRDTAKPTTAAPPASSDPNAAIQIPGAHKSFLAPDGIPFIDEDVDEEIETGRQGGDSSIPAVDHTVVAKPDVNKNVVKEPASSPPKPPVQPVVEVKPPTVVAAAERRPDEQPTPAQHQAEQQHQQASEQEKSWSAAIDVLKSDLELQDESGVDLSSIHVTETHTSTTVTTVTTESAVDHNLETSPPVSDEQQRAAAIKIQAGIRGYRDRQKVKAIRASKHNHADESAAAVSEDKDDHTATGDQQHNEGDGHETAELGATVQTEVNHEEQAENEQNEQDSSEHHQDDSAQSEDADDPKKQYAAVKIQASYKGWKTRKELGKVKE